MGFIQIDCEGTFLFCVGEALFIYLFIYSSAAQFNNSITKKSERRTGRVYWSCVDVEPVYFYSFIVVLLDGSEGSRGTGRQEITGEDKQKGQV